MHRVGAFDAEFHLGHSSPWDVYPHFLATLPFAGFYVAMRTAVGAVRMGRDSYIGSYDIEGYRSWKRPDTGGEA